MDPVAGVLAFLFFGFLGIVLLVSVCLGSFRLIRVRNRLDLFG